MKKLFLVFAVLLNSYGFIFSQNIHYSKVKVYLGEKGLMQLSELGIAVDHGEVKKGVYFVSDLSSQDIRAVQKSGLKYDILIDDVSKYYVERNKNLSTNRAEASRQACLAGSSFIDGIVTPEHFRLGSMGGFFTYDEALQILDSMTLLYPDLISARQPIGSGTTIEGRPVFQLKISDNPTVDENEPEMMYTALHHAREACSLSQLIYFMWYVLENYQTNPEIKALVDNTEMYFVPVINPDGYIYNYTTDPNGGGMWRKNRRDNTDGTFGVDLNRNYGQFWGFDDSGSSPDGSSDTYRGASAFSEPETQIIKEFCEVHQFKIAINYHTYSNLLIFPYGHTFAYCADSTIYLAQTGYMAKENGFKCGNAIHTVGYYSNGGSDDWMWGEVGTKPKIFAMTPEAGSFDDGFWPAINRIVPICKNTLTENIKAMELVHRCVTLEDKSPSVTANLNNYFTYNLQCIGLDSTGTYDVSISPVSGNVQTVGGSNSYNLVMLQSVFDSIPYTLSASIASGQTYSFVVAVNNGMYTITDTIVKTFGTNQAIYANAATVITDWASSAANTWNTTTSKFVSSPSSFTDSPSGDYADNRNITYTLSQAIDLSGLVNANLKFYAQWDIESGYDYVEVQASGDNGTSWTALCGKYTHAGNGNQDDGKPLYDGQQLTWVQEEMSLNDYLGQTIKLRYKLVSDQGVTGDGFYFDDLVVEGISSTTSVKKIDVISFGIYPNPAANSITLQLNNSEKSNLEIYDGVGKLIYNKPIVSATVSADWLASGVYYCRVTSASSKSELKKLVILK